MAKKPSKPTKPEPAPAAIVDYGCPVKNPEGDKQLFFDRYAFAKRLPIDTGAPPRPELFRRLADKFYPGHFEWHSWTERVVSSLCEYEWAGFAGCAGCVAGETRILNPITGKSPTIQYLYDNRIAPTVMTLEGPTVAEIPFIKGVDDLFEVQLENGHSFKATSEHLVLGSFSSANYWCRVSDLQIGQCLLSYASTRLPSTSEPAPLIRVRDGTYSPRKAVDCPGGYQAYCHSCGEPLLSGEAFGQLPVPLPVGVLARNHAGYLDGREREYERSHGKWSCHRSTQDYEIQNKLWDNLLQHRCDPEIAALGFQLFQPSFRFRSGCIPQGPFPKQDPDFSHKHFVCDVQNYSCGSAVARSKIVSIRKARKDVYYDICVPGPAHYFAEGTIHHNSCKTFNVAGFAAVWWLCYPEESSVIFCSTTVKSLRKRGWAEIQKLYTSMAGGYRYGNFVDSKTVWQNDKGDDKHAIVGVAVEDGSLTKVADNIKGHHTKRQMVIIDEATAVPGAIFEAASNLQSGCEEFLLVVIGNPRSKQDQMGRFCEPIDGWNSVTVDTDEWETKPQLNGKSGIVIRFDAEKSPNIIEGRLVSKYLPTKEKVDARRSKAGSQDDPSYWSNDRGFWPPEGLCKTVFSSSSLTLHDSQGQLQFTGRWFLILGGFDPAFGGGDRPALRFAKMGEIVGGKWGIQLFPPIVLNISASVTDPVTYQLRDKLKAHCDKFTFGGATYSCPPENLGVDDSGMSGLCDVLHRTWSPKIIRIEFGGRASEDPVSYEDARLACDRYDDKAGEMWFRARDAQEHEQLKGIDKDTAVELCNRLYEDNGVRCKLQPKTRDLKSGMKSYKSMYGNSPDLADSLAIVVEVARIRGFRLAPMGESVKRHVDFDKEVEAIAEVLDTADYSEEEDGRDFEQEYSYAYED